MTSGAGAAAAFFAQDLKQALGLLDGLRLDGAAPTAAAAEELQRRLERHFRWEDEHLFPALASRAGGLERVFAALSRDHERIRATLAALVRAVHAGNMKAATGEARQLREALLAHQEWEGPAVFARADAILGEEAADALLEGLPF